jgi:hypothetical protein
MKIQVIYDDLTLSEYDQLQKTSHVDYEFQCDLEAFKIDMIAEIGDPTKRIHSIHLMGLSD